MAQNIFGVIVIYLLFTCCTVFSYPLVQDTISWQLHSWNDLREWHQSLILKNANWFKIDFHMIEDCANVQTFDSKILPPGPCFLLSHDSPEKFLHTRKFFTSDSVLSFVKENLSLFQQVDKKIYIATCVKIHFLLCTASKRSHELIHLYTDFFTAAQFLISQYSLNLEFILDGAVSSVTASCIADLWRPWNKTWEHLNPASINNHSKELWSFDAPYDRLQLIDEPVVNIKFTNPSFYLSLLAKYKFGKFKNSTYPYLFWEPSEQALIHNVLSTYVQTGQVHFPGFRLAINIDPVMFLVYSGSISKKSC